MPFDGFVLAAVLAEVERECRGAFVDQVYQPSAARVAVAFTGRGPRRFLLLAIDPEAARCHLLPAKPEVPESPPACCMLLRKELRGARLQVVTQPRFDRVARLGFERGGETRWLVHEIMGRHSNLFLLDETETILGALKIVPPSRSRARPVLPAHPYEPAPTTRRDPRELTREAFQELAGTEALAPEWFGRQLNGFGPFAGAEVLARAGGSDPPVAWTALRGLLDTVAAAAFEPQLWRDGAGTPTDCWAFRSGQAAAAGQEPAPSMSAALAGVFGHREAGAALAALRGEARAALQRALAAQRRQRDEAQRHLEGLDDAEGLRIRGELLATHGGQVPRGANAVALPNYYDPEQRPLTIALQPELSARENAEAYFRRYRRAVAAAERAIDRLPAVEQRIQELEALAAQAETADEEALRALREQLRAGGVLREPAPPLARGPREKAALPPGVRVRRYEVEGWEVLWGENATSNDYLTTRLARPGDLWLHARAVAGAHVIIRVPGRDVPVPRKVLEAAARTAAAHSEAKHSSVIAVDYTQRRYVRKPRGAPPGAVLCTQEKTLHVTAQGAEEGARVE
jgi:predicted ribosome quality control (RQC) complex YloA/Tae2 family protein